MTDYEVLFLPKKNKSTVSEGETLINAAICAGIYINASCGGKGLCGKCKVEIKEGFVQGGISTKLTTYDLKKNYRLACMAKITQDVVINIPAESGDDSIVTESSFDSKQLAKIKQIEISELQEDGVFNLPVKKVYLELIKPDSLNRSTDLSRISESFKACYGKGDLDFDLSTIRKIPDIIRMSDFSITVTFIEPVKDNERIQITNIQPVKILVSLLM